MPKFAVYYVPDADDMLYQLGSELLGYDVRAHAPLMLPPSWHTHLPTFDPAWVALARPYGFHATIGDALDTTWTAIPRIEEELGALLQCFDPDHPWTLQRNPAAPLAAWGEPGSDVIVLRYEPNDTLLMLHTLVIARINSLATGSRYLQHYLLGQDVYSPACAQQTRLFYSPTVLDHWDPHFTLLNPYSGGDRESVMQGLAAVFESFSALVIRSLCLMVQPQEDGEWHIYRELRRPLP